MRTDTRNAVFRDHQGMTKAPDEIQDSNAVLAPRRGWVRTLAVAAFLCWVVFAFVGIGFLTIASPRLGWVWASLAYLPGVGAAVALFGLRRHRDTVITTLTVAALLGGCSFLAAPPDHARIEHEGDKALAHLKGATIVDHHQRGNTWCLQGCPQVAYSIDSDLPPDLASEVVAASLREAGWRGGPLRPGVQGGDSDYAPLALEQWSRGRWEATVTVLSQASRRLSEGAQTRARTRVEVVISG